MSMPSPRIASIQDAENRLRQHWQDFSQHWQETAPTWKDRRRQQFEQQYLRELPQLLARTHHEITRFRETLQHVSRLLADSPRHS